MMNTNFSTETRLTKQLCFAAARYLIWHNIVFQLFFVLGIILTAICPLYIINGYSFIQAFWADVAFIPGIFLIAALGIAPWFIGKNFYKKYGDCIIKMTFSDTGIVVNKNHEIIKLNYTDIKRYHQTSQYFFIWTRELDSIMYVIAKDTFTEGNPTDFTLFLRTRLGQTKIND
ncbi:YcxB family protein [Pectinatus frisingensis]|uniref:YcxB family protein n=1 Tax=Pectinatus frisingensis TaxID=865 RepID=UPI0018C72DC5|nr:YcxB family protein [Pectinatus frisingensis]